MADTFSSGDIAAAMSGSSSAPAASPAPDPASGSSLAVPANAPATAAPVSGSESATAGSPTTAPATVLGEPPKERWPEILENARTKTRAEAQAEFDQQYGWARQIQPAQFREMQTWYAKAHQDPIAFAQDLIGELQTHPVHGQALRSMAARALASGRGQAEMPTPDVQITNEHGQVVGTTYSAEGLQRRDQWLIQQVMAQVEQKYSPVQQTVAQIQQDRDDAEKTAQAERWSSGFMAEARQYPQFKEHAKEIMAAVVAEIKRQEGNPRIDTEHPSFLEAATLRAYNKVVLPKLQATERKAVVDSINQKASVSTANPAHGTVNAPKALKDMSWAEALKHEFARVGT